MQGYERNQQNEESRTLLFRPSSPVQEILLNCQRCYARGADESMMLWAYRFRNKLPVTNRIDGPANILWASLHSLGRLFALNKSRNGPTEPSRGYSSSHVRTCGKDIVCSDFGTAARLRKKQKRGVETKRADDLKQMKKARRNQIDSVEPAFCCRVRLCVAHSLLSNGKNAIPPSTWRF